MNEISIKKIYDKFPTKEDCVKYLETLRWKQNPVCPYCNVQYFTPLPKENRYHCNKCMASFSVTVRTIFHKTKLPLQKWFFAIYLILNTKKSISVRQLAKNINVNKNTAWYMCMRIRRGITQHKELMQGISELDLTT